MNRITAIGIGALSMYFFDPQQGARRRAMFRDRTGRMMRKASDEFDVAWRDLTNRAQGLWCDVLHLVTPARTPDHVLEERVRARVGHATTHPRAIEVQARGGCVFLSGPILADEHETLLAKVRATHGVHDVVDDLEVHRSQDLPALQGGARRSDDVTGWTPATRLLVMAGAGALSAWGMARRGPIGAGLMTAGFMLGARAAAAGNAGRRTWSARGIEIHKAIHVHAPVDRVFQFWSDVSNFPRFMSHALEVDDLGDGRTHWKVRGPAGAPVEWDAVTTHVVENQELCWESEPGALVAHCGKVRFEPAGEGTRVTVHMTYRPPAGMAGHALAALCGADPKSAMNEDLLRFKSLVEGGAAPRPRREAAARQGVD